jgi:hypothetical protein
MLRPPGAFDLAEITEIGGQSIRFVGNNGNTWWLWGRSEMFPGRRGSKNPVHDQNMEIFYLSFENHEKRQACESVFGPGYHPPSDRSRKSVSHRHIAPQSSKEEISSMWRLI